MSQIETSTGKVQGAERDGIEVFKGIPYAAPPVGELRWRSPQAHPGWSGVLQATDYSPISWQSINEAGGVLSFDPNNKPELSEDCLTLNIWTPSTDSEKRPVLFWIHGGGFVGGSGSSLIYDGARLAQRGDVVVVSINYRLGALGFVNLAEVTGGRIPASGNEGLEDQVFALKWVRDNIERFGGDPSNITIFGESAGGMSVGALMAFPAAKGLFHKAIPQSGACHTAINLSQATNIAEKLMSKLGVSPNKDVQALIDMPASQITEQGQRLAAEDNGVGMIFQPCVDGNVLPKLPIDSVKQGSADDVAVLAGATRDEWRLFVSMTPGIANMTEDQLRSQLQNDPQNDLSPMIEPYRDMLTSIGHDASPVAIHSAIQSERAFRIPAIRLAEAMSDRGCDTYEYLFTVESPAMKGILGSCHAIDIGYVFGSHTANKGTSTFFGGEDEHKQLAETVMDTWLSFARTGRPNDPLTDWQPYDRENRSTGVFGLPATVENDPYGEVRALWDQLESESPIGTF